MVVKWWFMIKHMSNPKPPPGVLTVLSPRLEANAFPVIGEFGDGGLETNQLQIRGHLEESSATTNVNPGLRNP